MALVYQLRARRSRVLTDQLINIKMEEKHEEVIDQIIMLCNDFPKTMLRAALRGIVKGVYQAGHDTGRENEHC